MRELRDWRKRRARDAAKKSKQGLATYRKERALTESVLEPQDEEA
jgi:hypothetical protein